jgi:molybdopterin-guanine dinucleotide biosynthesis protein A
VGSNEGTEGAPGPREALGAVLAGGRGRRIGGAKPTADLAGRPLISYPLAALAAAGIEAFVVAKPDTELPSSLIDAAMTGPRATPTELFTSTGASPSAESADLGASTPTNDQPASGTALPIGEAARTKVSLVIEAAEPTHPLAGIVAALRHAGRPLVVLGCDFPFAPPALLRALANAPEPLVVPAPDGEPQPLIARWSPELLPRLEATLRREESLRRTVAGLEPRLLDDAELAAFGDPARAFFNVNTCADLRAAAALL